MTDPYEPVVDYESIDHFESGADALRPEPQGPQEEHVGYWDSAGFLPLTALPVHVEDQRQFFKRARPLFAHSMAARPEPQGEQLAAAARECFDPARRMVPPLVTLYVKPEPWKRFLAALAAWDDASHAECSECRGAITFPHYHRDTLDGPEVVRLPDDASHTAEPEVEWERKRDAFLRRGDTPEGQR